VDGLEGCETKFARCCTPVPGDEIVGFITVGHGVSVHRSDCVNYIKSVANTRDAARWIHVEWDAGSDDVFATTLTVSSHSKDGMVLAIVGTLTTMKLHLSNLQARDTDDGSACEVTLEVPDRDALAAVIGKLRAIEGVYDVRRA